MASSSSQAAISRFTRAGDGHDDQDYLPRSIADASAPDDLVARDAAQRGTGEIILVVEDDSLMRKFSTDAATELGYTVLQAEDGSRLWQFWKAAPISRCCLPTS